MRGVRRRKGKGESNFVIISKNLYYKKEASF